MTTSTPNLGLVLYNSTTDQAEYFSNFRATIAGTSLSSNFYKIDTAYGSMQVEIDSIQAGAYFTEATYISANYYEATVAGITSYTTGMKIILKLNVASAGTVTLNINSLGIKSVMKINSSGTPVNISAGELMIGKYYLFAYDGTRWVWVDAVSSDQIYVSGTTGNVITVASDNTMDTSTTNTQFFSGIPCSPGGRLTLSSGVPVTTSDVTSATNIYYTPYIHNIIELWDGTYWKKVSYTQQTLAIGTVTADLPYDIFGYLNSGALAIEKLAWTSTTARATGISFQDGRYCKTGDKTRLYLGTFLSNSTTTTEDSFIFRGIYNFYNRVQRPLKVSETTSHTYNGATRKWNNSDTNNLLVFITGIVEDNINVVLKGNGTSTAGVVVWTYLYLNGAITDAVTLIYNTLTGFSAGALDNVYPALGKNIIQCYENSNGGDYSSMSIKSNIFQ